MDDLIVGVDGLNARQRQFAAEYAVDFDARAAAIRAGYPKKKAKERAADCLRNPKVKELIQKELEQHAKRRNISKDYIVDLIVETVERCRQAEPVFDRNGAPALVRTPSGMLRAAYQFNPSGVYEGAKLLGKHLGLDGFIDAKQSGNNVAVTVKIQQFSPEGETVDGEAMRVDISEAQANAPEIPPEKPDDNPPLAPRICDLSDNLFMTPQPAAETA